MNPSETDSAFAGSIPRLYETLMVPLIFEPYAEHLATRLAALAPKRVLEIAAGTGVVTRRMAALLPEHDHRRDRPQPGDARRGGAVGTARPVRMAAGRRDAAAVRRRELRRRRLPVRRHVLARQGQRPTRRRAACSHRAACFSSTSGTGSRTTSLPTSSRSTLRAIFPDDPPRFMARIAARLSRPCDHRARPAATAASTARPTWRRSRLSACASTAARGGGRLLPGHAAAQRDRGARHGRGWTRPPTLASRRSRRASDTARSTPRSRRTSSASHETTSPP